MRFFFSKFERSKPHELSYRPNILNEFVDFSEYFQKFCAIMKISMSKKKLKVNRETVSSIALKILECDDHKKTFKIHDASIIFKNFSFSFNCTKNNLINCNKSINFVWHEKRSVYSIIYERIFVIPRSTELLIETNFRLGLRLLCVFCKFLFYYKSVFRSYRVEKRGPIDFESFHGIRVPLLSRISPTSPIPFSHRPPQGDVSHLTKI